MDLYRTLVVLLTIFTFYHGMVNCLIGLRPANQAPHKHKVTHVPHPVSPKPSQTQYTQLHSPHDRPGTSHNYSVLETELESTNNQCQALSILRCSSHLLQQILRNSSHQCHDIQQFTNCVISALRENGRSDFVTGLVILRNLHFELKESFRCHGNATEVSLARVRHSVSKRHGARCCTEGMLNCAIQTFLKMTINTAERCQLVNYYDVCMNEVSKACSSSSVSTLYPVFVSQMKRQCLRPSNREKRSEIMKDVINLIT